MDVTKSAGLSRRTIVKGAAWSVPVIAAAVAVPMAAASTPQQDLNFFLTAGEVIGSAGAADGQIRSNGVRISPANPAEPKVVAAGSVFTITIEYHGTNPAIDFTDPLHGLAYNKGQCAAWSGIDVQKTRIVLTAVTPAPTAEPTIGSFAWFLRQRPEDNSITFTGIAVLAAGGDFPEGGTLVNLMVDPNAGTGGLSGPTPSTWSLA